MPAKKNLKLSDRNNAHPREWKLGDKVEIRHGRGMRGRIVELFGPLGPGGVNIYRVLVRRKPKKVYIEVREDQLIPISVEA